MTSLILPACEPGYDRERKREGGREGGTEGGRERESTQERES